MAPKMLFQDPKFRFPTSAARRFLLPIVEQFQLEKGTVRHFSPTNAIFHSVAAMTAAGPEDCLLIRVEGRSFSLPLMYLSILWPQPMKFAAALDGRIDVELVGPESAMVILLGTRQCE